MAEKKAWKGKTGGGNFGQQCLFFYFKHGSITLSYILLSVVIFFYLIVNYKATKNIFFYFNKRQKYSLLKSLISTYQNYYLFGKTLIDKFAIFAGKRDAYVVEKIGNEHYFEAVNNPDKGAILLNSHVGSAEIVGYLSSQRIKKNNVIGYGFEAPTMQGFRTKIMNEQNINMIRVVDSFSHIFEVNNALKNAELMTMAGDRIYEGSKKLSFQFLGALADFPIAPFQLAVKMKIPMLSLFVMQEGSKKYRSYVFKIEVENLEAYSPQQQIELLMQEYVTRLEIMMKKYPLQWYNFHKFWN
ncbi:MAG: lysophospholipid acyltransferase family protein [Paludibacteraceae bacterium]|nr:lysophospholipid acyltransferase family protein [Paludibacteraceae bacterium]MBN2788374.1 lysophospholipid acyltransferase family protein [Paludibacteraceae bacterium]